MKRIKIFSAMFVLSMAGILHAQSNSTNSARHKTRSVFIELFGPSNLIGISYDSRFTSHTSFGYRIGISYFKGGGTSLLGMSSNYGFFCPIEVNYLLGEKKHKFEIGSGVEIGFCSEKIFYFDIKTEQHITENNKIFGYYFYSNIGYRYQARNGFQFRVGINPTFSPDTKHAAKRDPFITPYISLGYAF